jgi:RNA polymerase sigma-70 factor, ECF subfamily
MEPEREIVLSRGEATEILKQSSAGESRKETDLVAAVYGELRRLAAAYMRGERPNHTLQATALVHEAYLRLIDATRVEWRDRAHFIGIAARLMRQILVEHARAHGAVKRGRGRVQVALDSGLVADAPLDADPLALDEILSTLQALHERRARVLELRLFGGLTLKEIGKALEISSKTVEADWYFARAWLRVELKKRGVEVGDA